MKKQGYIIAIGLVVFTGISQLAKAQVAAIKTNILYGTTTFTPNLGAEVALKKHTTLDFWGGYNPWNLKGSEENNKKAVHWIISPELRYWPGNVFSEHFWGIHLVASRYNVGGKDVPFLFDKKYRYQGYAIGGGFSYGYQHRLGKSWAAELELGLGVAHLSYNKYDCPKCGSIKGHEQKTYMGPTRANVSIVYLFDQHEH